jgi:hypothetical protein
MKVDAVDVEEDLPTSSARYRKLDMKRQEVEEDAEQIAERLEQRYGRQDYRGFRGDLEHVPQSLLIPSVNDPKLWLVRCKVSVIDVARVRESHCDEYLQKILQFGDELNPYSNSLVFLQRESQGLHISGSRKTGVCTASNRPDEQCLCH